MLVASQLNWPVLRLNSTENYATTEAIAQSLPKLILAYLDAAVGKVG